MNNLPPLAGSISHTRTGFFTARQPAQSVASNDSFLKHLVGHTQSAPSSRISDAERQILAARQSAITTTTAPQTTATTAAPAQTTPSADPFGPFGTGSATPTAAGPKTASPKDAKPASTTPASFDDAYWASQPPAVQKLRNITDPDQRAQAAVQLMSEGYAIDVPIMMWGWDPQITMQLRQSYGYTWVPSSSNAPVQNAPGLSVPGLASYDPTQGPAGAIKVSTNASDFTSFQST